MSFTRSRLKSNGIRTPSLTATCCEVQRGMSLHQGNLRLAFPSLTEYHIKALQLKLEPLYLQDRTSC